MAIALFSPLRARRSRIHASSPHAYDRSHTTEPVRGGTSARSANGSALSTWCPVRDRRWYLYTAPRSSPGTKPYHTPDDPSGRSAWRSLSQPLKSPMTATDVAFGAHTANEAPATPFTSRTRAPSILYA